MIVFILFVKEINVVKFLKWYESVCLFWVIWYNIVLMKVLLVLVVLICWMEIEEIIVWFLFVVRRVLFFLSVIVIIFVL